MYSNFTDPRAWLSYGILSHGTAPTGIYCLVGDHWLGATYWDFATYTRDAIIMVSNKEFEVAFWIGMYGIYGDLRYASYGGINGGLNNDTVYWQGVVLATN